MLLASASIVIFCVNIYPKIDYTLLLLNLPVHTRHIQTYSFYKSSDKFHSQRFNVPSPLKTS